MPYQGFLRSVIDAVGTSQLVDASGVEKVSLSWVSARMPTLP
jgi:hypothetical protein